MNSEHPEQFLRLFISSHHLVNNQENPVDLDIIYIYILIALLLMDARVYQSHINRMSIFLCAMCPFTHTRGAIGGMCRYRALRSLHKAPMWSFFSPIILKNVTGRVRGCRGGGGCGGGVGGSGGAGNQSRTTLRVKKKKKQPCSQRGKTPSSPPPNPTTPTAPPPSLLLLSVPDCLV